jgi:hypothetical protein
MLDSPGQQILNPFDPYHRHDNAQAFFIVREIIDKGLLGDEPPDHGDLNVNLLANLELSAEDVTHAEIRNHDEIARDFFWFESDDPPLRRGENRPNGHAEPTRRWIVAREFRRPQKHHRPLERLLPAALRIALPVQREQSLV